jgi:hypothetical protein
MLYWAESWMGNALLQIPNLITPLCHNSQGILQEGDDDEKAANGWQMGLQWLGPNLDVVLDGLAPCLELFQRVVWVGRAVAGRLARIRETVWVWVVCLTLGAGDADAR